MSRKHLVENFKVDKSVLRKIPLSEASNLVEKDGKKFKCRAAYEFPVWRLDKENLNERIYGTDLAESIIKQNKVTHGLMNHPEKDVDVGKIFCIERNPHIREGVMFVDGYLVGEYGQLVKEILEAGGEIGLSSSAYGDVQDKKVMLEGFEIERYADFVDNPSYEVFASNEGQIEIDNPNDNVEESKTKENEDIEDNATNITKTQTIKEEESRMPDKKLSIEEKNLKIGVNNLFKEVDATDSPRDKVRILNEIIDYCDNEDFAQEYIEKAQSQIDEINDNLHKLAEKAKEQEKEMKTLQETKETSDKSIEETSNELNEVKKTLDELTEKYDVAVDLLDNLKIREKKLKEMYEVALAEKNGMISASEYKELQIYTEGIEDKLNELKKTNLEYRRKVRKMEKSYDEGERGPKKGADYDDEQGEVPGEQDTGPDEYEEKESKNKKKERVRRVVKEDIEDIEDEKDIKEIQEEDDSNYRFTYDNLEVQQYYEDLYEQNPSVEKIREEILSKKTLMEAQKTYLNLKDLVENIPSPVRKRIKDMITEEDTGVRETVRKTSDFTSMLREGWN